MNNAECPIIDTFGRSLIVSDSHFNSVPFRRWMLYGSETRYKTYTNTDLLLTINSILLTRLQALRRCPNTWCPIIDSLLYTHHKTTVSGEPHCDSVNFVDPVTGAHTQTVERMWGGCKGMKKDTALQALQQLPTGIHVEETGFGENAFCNIIQHNYFTAIPMLA